MSGRHRRDDEPVAPGTAPAPEPVQPSPRDREGQPEQTANGQPAASSTGSERVGRRRAPGAPDTGSTPVVRDGEAPSSYSGGRRRRAPEEPSIVAPSVVPPSVVAPSVAPAPVRSEPDDSPAFPRPAASRSAAAAPAPATTLARAPERPAPERPAPEADDDALAPIDAPLASAAATVVTGLRRAEQRARERRAEQRKRFLVFGSLGLVLLVVLGLIGWRVIDSQVSHHKSTATSKQQTMLLQLVGADKRAINSALLGVTNATSDAAVLLIPSRLVVDVPGAGSMPFSQAASLADPATSRNALTDLTGVDVQSSYLLTPAALSGLVDKVGGIDVDVDTDVTSKSANGAVTVVVPAGQQHLTGAQAAAYASFSSAPTEPDQARLSRFNDVLRGILTKLPSSTAEVQTILSGLDGASGQPVALAAGILATLGQVEAAGSVAYDTLPVRDIDTGSAAVSYGLDATSADSLLKARFSGSMVGGSSSALRVLVENGVGTPGLAEKARAKLVTAGMRFVNGGNATQFGFTQTVVLIPDATSANQAKGARVAKALGVPVQDVQTSPRGQTVADVIVILGKDFTP